MEVWSGGDAHVKGQRGFSDSGDGTSLAAYLGVLRADLRRTGSRVDELACLMLYARRHGARNGRRDRTRFTRWDVRDSLLAPGEVVVSHGMSVG